MLSAEYGGSGGKSIESGMVVEEPDIEIGQGVSSKAISRRMQTDKGGTSGPRSGRDREEDEAPSRYRRSDRDDRDDRREDGDKDRHMSGMGNGNAGSIPNANAHPGMAGLQGFQMPGMPAGFPYSMQNMGLPAGMVMPPGFFGQQQQPPQPPAPGR